METGRTKYLCTCNDIYRTQDLVAVKTLNWTVHTISVEHLLELEPNACGDHVVRCTRQKTKHLI